MHVLVAGCGWLGQAVALAFQCRGARVTGIRRDPTRLAQLTTLGIQPLELDLADPASAELIPGDVQVIIACQAAGSDGVEPYRRAYVEANRTLLAAARHLHLVSYVYTGSTGVFGQQDGKDVDEATSPAPSSATADLLVEAERLVLSAVDRGVPTRLLRLSGLYGPGRVGVVDRVRTGRMALGPGDDVWTNWCHLEDAVQTVLAAVDRGQSGGIYHGSDAHPARRREVVEFVAERLGMKPPHSARQVSEIELSRGTNRRIISEKTRVALGISLRYPSFRDGLASHFDSVSRRAEEHPDG